MIEIRYYKKGLRFEPTKNEAKFFEDRIKLFAETPTHDRPNIGQKVKVVHGEKAGSQVVFLGLLFSCCLEPEAFAMTYICKPISETKPEIWYLSSKFLEIIFPENLDN